MAEPFSGAQAVNIVDTVQDILMDSLRAALNTGGSRYSVGRTVMVTPSYDVAVQCVNPPEGEGAKDVVLFTPGNMDATGGAVKLAGQVVPGSRHDMEFVLDMGASRDLAKDGPAALPAGDRQLADSVKAWARAYRTALDGQGVYSVVMEADPQNQKAAMRMNVHHITCFARTADEE